ncbi:MAG: hypothetical protein Roseis2KO_46970 [Roseivirga sp.]
MDYPANNYRIKASLLDAVLMLAMFTIASYIIDANGGAPSWLRILLLGGTIYLYDPLMVALFRGTLGHKFMGLRVVRFSDHQKRVNPLLAAVRFAIKYFLGFISIIFCYVREDRRALHDLVCNSHVVFKESIQAQKSDKD